MESRPIMFPQQLHYSCHTCAGCCRGGWHVVLTETEAARFKDHDWTSIHPRYRDIQVLQPMGNGLLEIAKAEDGGCIFLDDDNLCAIHKELGFDAKPLMCKYFPYYLTDTPDGVVASFDFACPTVIADDGRAIAEHEPDMRDIMAESTVMAAEMKGRLAAGGAGAVGPGLEARKGVPLAWADYLALDNGLQRVLGDATRPLTERLLIVDELITRAGDHAAPGGLKPWIEEAAAQHWDPILNNAIPPPVSPLRQRALVAAAVSAIEGGWAERFRGGSSATSRVGLATALLTSKSLIWLPTADAGLYLGRMLRTRFAQDDPALNGSLSRFLIAYIARKSLINGTSVLQGGRNLALYFGTIRWYAVARAVLAERAAVEEADIRYAIRLAEQTLSHSPSFKTPRFTTLVNLLFNHVAPARTLYPSRYPT